jgi:hypothetical protein
MDTNHLKYIKGIKTTGFPLEFAVGEVLKGDDWNVINNKYYIDSNQQIPREIDLIAYKAGMNSNDVMVYTTLIVSCKKNSDNIWAFLTKELDPTNPNTDWWPLHIWSNDKILQYELVQTDRKKKYHSEARVLGVSQVLGIPDRDVFAFQELNLASGKPQNDKNIYGSVSSLIQAQAYELKALPDRKKGQICFYQFNLLSVIESDMLRLEFSNSGISSVSVNFEHHIARYIFDKNETFSRIHFLRDHVLPDALKDYNRLHRANITLSSQLSKEYYSQVIQDQKRSAVLYKEFRSSLSWYLNYRVKKELSIDVNFNEIVFLWDAKSDTLEIRGFDDFNVVEFLNDDVDVQDKTKKSLFDIYRYSGEFKFTDDIPF